LDLPTLFHDKPVAIDIHHLHRFTDIVINKHSHVGVSNIPVREGVVHVVLSVIVPPRPDELELEHEHKLDIDQEHEHEHEHEHEDEHKGEYKHKREHKHKKEENEDHEHHDHLSVRDLMERLDRFIE
jgi:hypothetical protein